jgi:hypothetical protein
MSEEQDQVLVAALRENHQLKTWIAGLLAECEGCGVEVRAWAAATELAHQIPEPVTPDGS